MTAGTVIRAALWLALFGAMFGSVQHVAWSFATLSNGNMLSGYIQAIATDIGIAALAFGIQQRKRQRRATLLLWVIMLMFAGVSVYANLLYGLAHLHDIGVGPLEKARPFIMSAVLPLMVLSLAEVVSEDIQHAAKEADKERQRVARRERQAVSRVDGVDSRVDTGVDVSKDAALHALLEALTRDPDVTVTALAARIGKSRGTVYNYLAELEQDGHVERVDAGGFKVTSNGRE